MSMENLKIYIAQIRENPVSGVGLMAKDVSGENSKLRTGSLLMLIAALGFIGYAVIFFVRNFTDNFLELGITSAQVNVGKTQIMAFSQSLFNYVSHLHVAVSGFIAATGLAVAGLAWYGVRRGMMWAWVFAVASPVLALAVALPLHYVYGIATIGHLGLIYVATAIFVVGALMALQGLKEQKAF
jgi:phosphoglycerol transferase MdoB-like AlkP superfamily enzyme